MKEEINYFKFASDTERPLSIIFLCKENFVNSANEEINYYFMLLSKELVKRSLFLSNRFT